MNTIMLRTQPVLSGDAKSVEVIDDSLWQLEIAGSDFRSSPAERLVLDGWVCWHNRNQKHRLIALAIDSLVNSQAESKLGSKQVVLGTDLGNTNKGVRGDVRVIWL